MSIPTCMLPAIARLKLRAYPPYSALDDFDVAEAGPVPETPEQPSAYQEAKLNRFYAELAYFRPGVSRLALVSVPWGPCRRWWT